MMRRYWDLTEKERATLTDEQVRAYLDVELMEQGVLRPVPPTMEPELAAHVATEKRYAIRYANYKKLDVVFRTAAAAEEFIQQGAEVVERDYDAQLDVFGALADATIEPIEVATRDAALAARPARRENKDRRERFERAETQYREDLKAVDAACESMWSDWRACRDKALSNERIHATWNDYLRMSDGDRDVAWRFLAKAYSESRLREAFEWLGLTPPPDVPRTGEAA